MAPPSFLILAGLVALCGARTALHDAALVGDVHAAQAALDAGASLRATSGDGHTPLHDAAIRGNNNVVTFLLDKGADLDFETWDGVTALHLAASKGFTAVIETLLQRGAKLEAPGSSHKDRPLHRAVGGGSIDAVKLLLSHGATIAADKYGYTPLHTAAAVGNVAVARLLIDHGATLDATNEDGKTPLDVAESNQHSAQVMAQMKALLGGNGAGKPKDEV